MVGVIFAFCFGLGVAVSKAEKAKGKKGWAEGHKPHGLYEREIKRPLDFALALFALILLWPLMAITALAVKVKLGKPVIFKQDRPGLNGKIFTIRKFRTMIDGEGADQERLTDFGRKLRSTSIDELPELWNILCGDMSVVGPRPERPELTRDYEKEMPEFRFRLKVKAGLTGYAQVTGVYDTTPYDKLKMDLMYIENYSFILDIRIILMTIKTMILPGEMNSQRKNREKDIADKGGKM